jgi:hypothetical protein
VNAFFNDFERFLPSAWFTGGITESGQGYDRGGAKPRARTGIRPWVTKTSVAFAAAAFAVSSLGSLGNVSQTPVRWTVSGIETIVAASDATSRDYVPPNYWAKLISDIKVMPMISEEDFEDIESFF